MVLKDLQEKRNRLFMEAQTLMSVPEITPETRTKVNAIMADVDTLESDIRTTEKLEKIEAELRSTKRPPRGEPGAGTADASQDEAVTRAFSNFVRFGERHMTGEDRSLLVERRDITTTGASGNTNGSFIIPQIFDPVLYQARKLIGNTVSIVGKKVTNNNGAPMKIGFVNDTANTLVTMTGEATLVSEVDPLFSGVVMSTDTIGTMVKVSVQELEDSAFDLNTWIKQQFGIRYYRGLEKTITLGNGSNVASVVTTATAAPAAASNLGPVYDDFTATYSALDPAYEGNASWVFNSTTRANLLGQKDNYGRPLWTPNPTSGVLDHILGRPIVLNQALPSAFNNTSTTVPVTGILYGDFEQGYLLRTDGPLSIRRFDELFMASLEVGFLAYSRIGGVSTDAGTHPLLSMSTPIA